MKRWQRCRRGWRWGSRRTSSTWRQPAAPWKLLARGQVVQETPRWVMIQDTLNHWAHHRGPLTVYLRLLGAKVPSIYGPSADDKQFR